MKIYVKESKSLSIQTVSLMFYDSVTIVPLLSLDDVLYSDLIIVSQSDVSSMTGLEEYHVIIYEQLFQELFKIQHIAFQTTVKKILVLGISFINICTFVSL